MLGKVNGLILQPMAQTNHTIQAALAPVPQPRDDPGNRPASALCSYQSQSAEGKKQ